MISLTQQERQVIEMFRQLEPERRRAVLLEMVQADGNSWKQYQAKGVSRLRELAREQGQDWDSMSDDQKQDFIEELVGGEAR